MFISSITYTTKKFFISKSYIIMKGKNNKGNNQKPSWMNEEAERYIADLKSNQERGFQKKLSQWKSEKESLNASRTNLKAALASIRQNPEAIKELIIKDPQTAREVVEVFGKDFFVKQEGEELKPIQFEMPNVSLNRDEIIAQYEAEKKAEMRDQHISELYRQFYSDFELDQDETTAFEKSVNELIGPVEDLDSISKLFGYSVSEFKKAHLKDDALNNQMGGQFGGGGYDHLSEKGNGAVNTISDEQKAFFDSL